MRGPPACPQIPDQISKTFQARRFAESPGLKIVVLAETKPITPTDLRRPSAQQVGAPEPAPVRTRITRELRLRVIGRYTSTAISAQDCAEEFGIAKATVLRILKEGGVPVRPQGQRLT